MPTPMKVKRQARQAAHEAAPWVELLARLGYASKGVVYLVIGLLAARAAFGQGGKTTDTRGAIENIGQQPFGQAMLAVLAVGLVGYALWQLVRSALDPEGQGHHLKGLVKRAGYAISGGAYLTLAYFAAARTVRAGAAGGGGQSQEDWTARLLSVPYGRWLVALVALGILAVAANQFYVAYKAAFMRRIRTEELGEKRRLTVKRFGQFGIAARGVVLSIIAWFFAMAAWTQNPEQAGGLSEALRTLQRQPYGPWLLGVVALGLAAFGVYAVIVGRFRRIRLE